MAYKALALELDWSYSITLLFRGVRVRPCPPKIRSDLPTAVPQLLQLRNASTCTSIQN